VNAFPVQCCFSRDGSLLLSGSSDGRIVMYGWDESRSRLEWKAHQSASIGIDFHTHDERLVASSSWGGEVSLWDVDPNPPKA
jgi:WD40 repeat protein